MRFRFVTALIAAIVVTGCDGDTTITPRARPTLNDVALTANPHNALSLIASFGSSNADSARVVFWSSDARDSTPYFMVSDDSTARIPLLALQPSTSYHALIEVAGANGIVQSDTLQGSSGALPAVLSAVHLDITGTPSTEGFLLTQTLNFNGDTAGYILAFDGTGAIRWYREYHEGYAVVETKQQKNGNITVYAGPPRRLAAFFRYDELTPDGTIIRSYKAPPPLYSDLHELLLTTTSTGQTIAHYFAYDYRHFDLSATGGPADTAIAGHRLIRQAHGASPEFVWNSWDHFGRIDTVEPGSDGTQAMDHPNSLDIDADGHYVVSWRNLGEITKIHSQTGVKLWRFGGRNNQFTIIGDPLNGFSGQHYARMLPNGNLLLFDNGYRHEPRESRAVEYRLDVAARTATFVWQYRDQPAIFTPYVGSAQRYANGNTLVGFGFSARMAEATPAGTAKWSGWMRDGTKPITFYRIEKVKSLYRYETP